MKRLGTVIQDLLKTRGIERPVLQNKAMIIWNDVVGELIARNTEPEEVKHGVLIVKTSTPVWRNELVFRKKEILKELNRKLGKKTIKEIRLL